MRVGGFCLGHGLLGTARRHQLKTQHGGVWLQSMVPMAISARAMRPTHLPEGTHSEQSDLPLCYQRLCVARKMRNMFFLARHHNQDAGIRSLVRERERERERERALHLPNSCNPTIAILAFKLLRSFLVAHALTLIASMCLASTCSGRGSSNPGGDVESGGFEGA